MCKEQEQWTVHSIVHWWFSCHKSMTGPFGLVPWPTILEATDHIVVAHLVTPKGSLHYLWSQTSSTGGYCYMPDGLPPDPPYGQTSWPVDQHTCEGMWKHEVCMTFDNEAVQHAEHATSTGTNYLLWIRWIVITFPKADNQYMYHHPNKWTPCCVKTLETGLVNVLKAYVSFVVLKPQEAKNHREVCITEVMVWISIWPSFHLVMRN